AALVVLIGVIGFAPPMESIPLFGTSVAAFWLWLLCIRFAMGVFTAPIYPASGRAVGNWIPLPRRAGANGLITGAALVGNASSFMVFGALIAAWDWPATFVLTRIVTACLALAWMIFARDHPRQLFEEKAIPEQLHVTAAPAADLESNLSGGQAPAASESDPWWTLLWNRSLVLLTIAYAAIGYFEYLFFF